MMNRGMRVGLAIVWASLASILMPTSASGQGNANRALASVFRGASLERVDNRRIRVFPGTIGFPDGSVRAISAPLTADLAFDLDTGPAPPVNDQHYAVFATADHAGTDFQVRFSKARAESTGGLVAGFGITIPIVDTTGFAPGQLVSVEASPTSMEFARVLTVGPGQITVEELKGSYPSATVRVRAGHMPQGVTSYRLIGWVYFFRGALLRFRQVDQTVFYEEPTSFVEVANGNPTDYTPVSLFLPPIRACTVILGGRIKIRPMIFGEAHVLFSSNGLGICRDVVFGGSAAGQTLPFQTEAPAVGGMLYYRVTVPEHQVNVLLSGYRCDPSNEWNW